MKLTPVQRALLKVHRGIDACRSCPKMVGPPVHGPAVESRIMLLGQAPGPREAGFGRPFAWTAGRTMFGWFESELGAPEAMFRDRVYIAAVARCFPGKAKGGGDRKPDPSETAECQRWLKEEVGVLSPSLLIPVGTVAIEQVLRHKGPLADVVGRAFRAKYLGAEVDVLPLPHPSGASTWHRMEPGVTLLKKALALLAEHPEVKRAFPRT